MVSRQLYGRTLEFLGLRKRAYQFGLSSVLEGKKNPLAEPMIADLIRFARLLEPYFGSERDQARMEGRREVVLRILQNYYLPPEDLFRLYSTYKPPEDDQ